MCVAMDSSRVNPTSRLLGKNYKYLDPVMAGAERLERKAFQGPSAPKTSVMPNYESADSATLLTQPKGRQAYSGTLLGGA